MFQWNKKMVVTNLEASSSFPWMFFDSASGYLVYDYNHHIRKKSLRGAVHVLAGIWIVIEHLLVTVVKDQN